MKRIISTALVLALAAVAGLHPAAEALEIERLPLGSGEPGLNGFENAVPVAIDDEVYHVPQYLPGFPTAATLWPRIIRVRCRQGPSMLQCEGYQWSPALGRGEYLYFVPVIVPPASSQ